MEIRPCPNWWLVNPCHIRDLAHIGTAQIDSCRAIFAFFVPHSFAQRFRNLQTMSIADYRKSYASGFVSMFKKSGKGLDARILGARTRHE